jgi:hypothetical protein
MSTEQAWTVFAKATGIEVPFEVLCYVNVSHLSFNAFAPFAFCMLTSKLSLYSQDEDSKELEKNLTITNKAKLRMFLDKASDQTPRKSSLESPAAGVAVQNNNSQNIAEGGSALYVQGNYNEAPKTIADEDCFAGHNLGSLDAALVTKALSCQSPAHADRIGGTVAAVFKGYHKITRQVAPQTSRLSPI